MTEYDDLSASIDAIRHNRDRDTDNRRSKIEILREVAATILKDLNSGALFIMMDSAPIISSMIPRDWSISVSIPTHLC